ncbi:hypothetical protein B0T26DRAFT_644238 [Lasiosphaeria miniovina]|uniref:BHLH domain-containing protein n=1 Tax=Lasiosphaeria miniovina TaxID=1954250 RepID=A0AA40AV25_9PEZI|nr:uncharacterized protein B0T26DRAFT_644238 [Lasiosphaeria miniovina]KAK0722498.1 hypothetical protein B0T26DRAFT_644238 [Lasiosphaeria miniovina]
MATVGMELPDLPDVQTTPGHKRKRASDSTSPESRRNKRGAPAAAMTVPDADAQAFLENTVSIAQAAQDHVNVDDFSALAQATADHSDAADTANASSTAAAALNMYPTLHVPPSTEETFAAQAVADSHHHDDSFNASSVSQPDGLPMASSSSMQPNGVSQDARYGLGSNPKPAVGSEEWHKMRKDNHKEVERRRRETINEGINELAKIVPGCEKNKGSILQRAVSFITQLKENETQNIEKWTLEKLLTEQAIAELSQSNDKLKHECERLYRELEAYKRMAQTAGLQPPQQKEEPGTNN